MGVVILVLFLGGFVAVSMAMTSARTAARKSANAGVRQSLVVESGLPADRLSALVASSLVAAGASRVGSFDGASFFLLQKHTELRMTVTEAEHGSRASVTLPSVRTVSGRPQKLAPVGRALDHVARAI